MNWNEIKEKCPKGYKKFSKFARNNFEYVMRKDYWEIDVCVVDGERIYTDVRDEELSGVLMRFFGKNKIYVLPYLDVGDMDDWGFDCSIKNGSNNHLTIISSKSATRINAEANAFEKAFEIFEERLI